MEKINFEEFKSKMEVNKNKKNVILGIIEEDKELYMSIHPMSYIRNRINETNYDHDLVGEIVHMQFLDENDMINGGTLEVIKKGFLENKIKTYDNGRQVVNMPNSVNFLIYLQKENKVLMSKQFRASEGKSSINLFGGYIDDGETIFDAMMREMKEETNICKCNVTNVEEIYSNKYVSMGYTTERNSLFIVTIGDKMINELDIKCNDEDENIEMAYYPLNEALVKLKNSTDGLKTFLALERLGHMTKGTL
ncbi:MAG: NUDIX hydrolase [Aeromonas jandaei]